MNARNTPIRPIFALALAISLALTLGIVLALAQHYGDEALMERAVTMLVAAHCADQGPQL